MKFIYIAIKGLKEIFRDRKGLAFLVAFPAIFMLVFGLAFSGGQGENRPYSIGVINRDEGTVITGPEDKDQRQDFGNELVTAIEGLTFEGSDVSMFEIRQVDAKEGDNLLKDRDIAATLKIPADFSESVGQLINRTVRREVTGQVGEMIITEFNKMTSSGTGGFKLEDFSPENFSEQNSDDLPEDRSLPEVKEKTTEVIIKGDPGYVAYNKSRGILVGIISQFKEEVVERARKETSSKFGEGSSSSSQFLTVKSESISGTQSLTTFDYYAPGIFIFALL
ncbi:ABC transporter permease, partial [Candidatus Bipolaricaulota bacterium]|nr:ABC transporter permease [Candidatus Bipolaricaulota bacterium]